MFEIVIIEKELSYLIMQAAYEVHNELGPGFPESIYEEAMTRELTRRGISIERQKEAVVCFKGEPLGRFFLDNVANDRVALFELAIVIDFGAERVQASRVVNTKGRVKLPPSFPGLRNLPKRVE